MRIHTELVYNWDEAAQAYQLVSERGFDFPDNGIEWCKGASAAQNAIANQQQAFNSTLESDYSTQFANQSNILSSLTNSFAPTLAAGPNQYGFNAAETNNLNSNVINNTASQYANATRALGANQGAQGGGNALLPSGVKSGEQAALAASAANQTATGLTGVQQAGYEQGRQNYNNAAGALGGAAAQYNPTGYAGSANQAGSAAMSSANTVEQINAANNPWTILGGALGGPLSQAVGGLLGGSSGGAPSASGPSTGIGMGLESMGASGGPLSTESSALTDLLPLAAI